MDIPTPQVAPPLITCAQLLKTPKLIKEEMCPIQDFCVNSFTKSKLVRTLEDLGQACNLGIKYR